MRGVSAPAVDQNIPAAPDSTGVPDTRWETPPNDGIAWRGVPEKYLGMFLTCQTLYLLPLFPFPHYWEVLSPSIWRGESG